MGLTVGYSGRGPIVTANLNHIAHPCVVVKPFKVERNKGIIRFKKNERYTVSFQGSVCGIGYLLMDEYGDKEITRIDYWDFDNNFRLYDKSVNNNEMENFYNMLKQVVDNNPKDKQLKELKKQFSKAYKIKRRK